MPKKHVPKKLKQWHNKSKIVHVSFASSEPAIPPKKRGPKLNLGCGGDRRKGWINVDIRPSVNPDVVHDLMKPLPFENESVDKIVAKDVLEHFPFRATERIVKDWHRVMQRGGELYIQCPDMLILAQRIVNGQTKDHFAVSYRIYGEQDYSHNYHKAGFTIPTLELLLEVAGFKITKVETSGANIMMWAEKT